MPILRAEQDEYGDWVVREQGRVVRRADTKQAAKEAAMERARPGDTVQLFNTDGSLFNEWIVSDDGSTTGAFTEGREAGADRGRDEGLFGAGIW